MFRSQESKSAPVGVVSKVLRILETLDASPSGLQLRQIARETNIHKSTAYRFLAHLEREGYLFRDEAGAYIVGPKLANLGAGVAYHATLRRVSRNAMQKIWKATQETVNLGVVDGLDVLYLDVIESAHLFRMGSLVGMRRPLNCTALGKAMLAYLPREQKEEMFSSLTFERLTAHTISNLPRFRKEIARIAQQGYAVDEQETELGARCVASPIFDASGRVAAAVSVSGPTTRITRAKVQPLAALLAKTLREISQRLESRA